MATKGLLSAAAVCAALLGCATAVAPRDARVNCNSGSCTIPIHVENCVITAPDVDVFAQSVNLFWEIDQDSAHAGYKFPDIVVHLGIWIKDDPKGEFEQPDRQNDRKFKLHDKNTSAGKGSYRYGVQVVKGSTTCTLDPFVVNH
jgi:hypothetical protein